MMRVRESERGSKASSLADLFLRWRFRKVWSDPARRLRTLQSFAETEEDGGRDLELTARRSADAALRGHFLRHAADEKRHATLFRQHAAEARAILVRPAWDPGAPELAYDLSRGRKGHAVDAHGFFRTGLYDELGEVAYVAMLNVAEQRAARTFALHRRLNVGDPPLCATFDEILRDEKYHIAYTARLLARWRAEGRAPEVEDGLRAARASRALAAWKGLGLRSAAGFSRGLLLVLYWTLLAPFALAARLARPSPTLLEFRKAAEAGPARSRSLAGQA